MSASITTQSPQEQLFTKVEDLLESMPLKPNSDTIQKVRQDLEKRLGPRKIKSQFDISEIQEVAEIVDELLEKRRLKENMASAESHRVAPAPIPMPRRHQMYQEQQPTILSTQNGSFQSEDNLRGIYTLPSTNDPEGLQLNDYSSTPKQLPHLPTGDSKFLNAKLVANLLAAIQLIFILLFAVFISYEEGNVSASLKRQTSQRPTRRPNYDDNFYTPSYNERMFHNNEDGRAQVQPQSQPLEAEEVETGQNLHQFYYCTFFHCITEFY